MVLEHSIFEQARHVKMEMGLTTIINQSSTGEEVSQVSTEGLCAPLRSARNMYV